MNIEQAICESIDIIIEKRLNDANFDKTIQATILNCEDVSIGKYKVKYQDSTFYAYAGSNIKYENGTEVFILVPSNDMGKDKTIIGTTKDRIGQQYTPDAASPYVNSNFNCFYDTGEYALCSYKSDSVLINNVNSATTKTLFNYCINSMDALLFTADFKTSLPAEQQFGNGKYGLEVGLIYKDKGGNKLVDKFIFDVNSFVGQIYKLTKYTSQSSKQINLHDKDYEEISYIAFFCKNFPNQNASINTPDIFVKNIRVFGQIQLTQEELNDCAVKVNVINGPWLDSNLDHSTLEANFYIKGSLANSTNHKYYWFKEDLNVEDETSNGYCIYGGAGWRCLNEYAGEWVPGASKLDIPNSEMGNNTVKYKCVIPFMNKIYSDAVRFNLNTGAIDKVIITSNNGTTFYLGLGSFTLTCSLTGDLEGLPASNYLYSWGVEKDGEYISLPDQTSNIISNIKATEIGNSSIYKCQVVEKATGVNLGIASIEIINKNELEGDYRLDIINGDQVFKYNESGLSPTNNLMETPMEIQPLTFIIYDNFNRPIINEEVQFNSIQWLVPRNKSMLTTSLVVNSVYNDYNVYKNLVEFSFSVRPNYYIEYTNNIIQLVVDFYGKVLTATTNFTILKDGEPGTNGTNFYCRLVPYATGENFSDYPTVYRNYSGGVSYNFPVSGSQWFTAELWENGTEINLASAPITYKILKHINSSEVSSYTLSGTSFGYNSSSSRPNLTTAAPHNIIQTIVKYNNNTYYGSLGLITTESLTSANYKASLKYQTGFTYVLYSSDGKNPSYVNAPFEIIVIDSNGNDVSLNNNITYTWSMVNNYLTLLNSSLLNKNQKSVKPIESFDGYSLNNAIICTVNYNSSAVARIHIPIHMYLNRYGNSAINGWDGNTLDIDNKGGVILAPQIGAGEKNNSNQFTGVVMGKIKESGQSEADNGLVGYNNGIRTIFLDSKTGNAIFGSADKGQIKITPTEGVIRSGKYSTSEGMEIDFYDPHIKYGNGKFEVDNAGNLKATNANLKSATVEGNITATSLNIANATIEGKIPSDNVDIEIPEVPDNIITTDNIPANIITTEKIEITESTDKDGRLTQTVKIGDNKTYKTITSADGSYLLTNVGVGTYQDPSNTNPTNTYFLVDTDGLLKANNAIIYGTIYATNGRFSGEISASTITGGSITGTSITNGSNFSVDAGGNLKANNAILESATVKGTLTAGTGSALGGWKVYHDYILMSAYYNGDKKGTDVNTNTEKTGLYYGIALDSRPDAFQNAQDIRVFSAGWLGSGGEGPNQESSVANGSWGNAAFSIFASGKVEMKNADITGNIKTKSIYCYPGNSATPLFYVTQTGSNYGLIGCWNFYEKGFTVDYELDNYFYEVQLQAEGISVVKTNNAGYDEARVFKYWHEIVGAY